MKKITVIEPNLSEQNQEALGKIRVCAYCRVSSMHMEQQNSFESQVSYYTKFINNNPEWEFIGIYADYGITGTKKEKRPEFMRLISDCENRLVDMVITKSISRFARNTADCLETVRKLKTLGVCVYFEKENINSMSQESELILSILSSLAQSESSELSANIRWANQKRYKQGKYQISCRKFIGYDFDKDKGLVINKAEAEIVKRIFSEYLGGKGTNNIAKGLNKDNIKTVTGIKWCGSGISRMLKNEKYMGDVLLQKTITADSITFSRKRNKGELPQYYIKNDHEPIISREDFKRVQELNEKRKKEKGVDENVIKRMGNRYPLSGKIICGNCGKTFKRSILNSNKKYRGVAYKCQSNIYEQTGQCYASAVREKRVYEAFVKLYNKLYSNWKTLLTPYMMHLKSLVLLRVDQAEIQKINNQINELIREKHRYYCPPEAEYLKPVLLSQKINSFNAEMKELETKKQALAVSLIEKDISLSETEKFIAFNKKQQGLLDEFDEDCFSMLVDKIIAKPNNCIRFCLKNGMELDEYIGGDDNAV
ncbi:recombinase family protein [Ruminiclostridium herbifermentans]|uniref:Recombinase family protein n=1 Tax=Ruminiclostridium herbifermentans TaxID=2488810 RepID=A0A4U7J7D3_9FIRM|nr:recombinase family protein [Ruminiclostridium herbifermentans]QNU66525.1 recombinase family protein [Ruminiclostridium herbifermentans]